MGVLHDTYVGLGSALLIAGSASIVSGIVLLSTTKRKRYCHADSYNVTYSRCAS
jgi:hypothetical protein